MTGTARQLRWTALGLALLLVAALRQAYPSPLEGGVIPLDPGAVLTLDNTVLTRFNGGAGMPG